MPESQKEPSFYNDARFDLQPERVEAEILHHKRETEHQLWIGLPVKILLTPYEEIDSILKLLDPKPGNRIVDLGAGYGRIGFVLGCSRPLVEFVGYEYVKQRVTESLRCLAKEKFSRVQMIHADLNAPDFTPISADIYFMYDFGNREAIEKTLHDLRHTAQTRPITVVGRGRASRDAIERRHPWLSQVISPAHYKNYSIYRSA